MNASANKFCNFITKFVSVKFKCARENQSFISIFIVFLNVGLNLSLG